MLTIVTRPATGDGGQPEVMVEPDAGARRRGASVVPAVPASHVVHRMRGQ
jgi:hypothetical protein